MKILLALSWLSLALCAGCAKGGNGENGGIAVTVTGDPVVGATLSATYAATVTGTTNTAVTWSVNGKQCTGNPNPCGTINPTTGVYTAPATAPTPNAITIAAASQADSTAFGDTTVNIVPVSVVVTPGASSVVQVGENLVQQFTAVAVPDAAPQTFAWACTPSAACGGFVAGANNSGVAVFTAPATAQTGVQISATWTPAAGAAQESPLGVGTAKVSVVASRLLSGSYAFQLTGYDNNVPPGAVEAAGSFTLSATGTISAGVEDVLTSSGPEQRPIASVSYTPGGTNNSEGRLTISFTNTNIVNSYTAAVTSSGIFRMIESDGLGSGSGVLQKSAGSGAFNGGAQTFAFGFSGVDASGAPVGYAGVAPLTPGTNGGTISGGLLDSNDNGVATNLCSSPPCSFSGVYTLNSNTGVWHMTLNTTPALDFDFFIASGATQEKTGPNPLTLYAISTAPIDATHPAFSGSMVYQVPMTYNNAAFSGSSVSALAGVSPGTANSSNVALVNGTTDGTSGGTGGTGGFSGNFDQNDNGVIVSVSAFPGATQSPSPYTYVASNGNTGRYIFYMLGNPGASTVVAPIPFVLYASGANRGFLLDQSSAAVMTGAMVPQPTSANFDYTATELPGAYAGATTTSTTFALTPFVENLLLTSTGNATYSVAGAENTGTGDQGLTGAYTLNSNGTGTITLTTPPPPSVATNAIYAVDVSTVPNPGDSGAPNYVITDFFSIGTVSGTASGILFAQQ